MEIYVQPEYMKMICLPIPILTAVM